MAACTRGTLCRMARHARLCGSRNRTLASVKDGSIQSLPYFQNVDRQGDEAWDSFVARAAAETLAYLKAFTPKFIEVKCPRLLYQSQCKFSVDDSAGMRSGAGDGV